MRSATKTYLIIPAFLTLGVVASSFLLTTAGVRWVVPGPNDNLAGEEQTDWPHSDATEAFDSSPTVEVR